MKPPKILYENQEDAWSKAEVNLKKLLSNCHSVKEAYVWASLAEGKFGIYEKPYRDQIGSDIDLVIVMNEPIQIPKDWKFTKVEKSWFDLYHLGYFDYEGHKHQIDGLIVIPSKHDIKKMRKSLEGRCRKIC
jgi:predicted nucleotidyltransferase